MHDIVAHSVSVMVVQAGAARRLVERDPAAAAEALGLVEATGRDALREMRRVVGVLRAGGDGERAGEADAAELEPQPALGDVPALVGGYRDAGLDVRLRTDGEPRPLALGRRARRLPHRPGGAHQHDEARRARPAPRSGSRSRPDALTVVVADDGRGRGLRARAAAATGWRACASG